jgi:hypothetical protein
VAQSKGGQAVKQFKKRIKEAFRTNETQATAVMAMSLMMVAAYAQREGDFDPVVAVVLLCVWPSIAFAANLIDPLP